MFGFSEKNYFWFWRNNVKFTYCFNSHGMLLLLLTNIFIHIQQLRFYSRLYFFAFNGILFYSRICSHSTIYIRSHSRSKCWFNMVQYSINIFCAQPLHIIRSKLPFYNLSKPYGGRKVHQWPKSSNTSVTWAVGDSRLLDDSSSGRLDNLVEHFMRDHET